MTDNPEIPKFFVPAAGLSEEAEEVREAVISYLGESGYYVARDERIYSLDFWWHGRPGRAVVGELWQINQQPVIAIFRCTNFEGVYLVTTTTRGVVRGEPIEIDDRPSPVYFAK